MQSILPAGALADDSSPSCPPSGNYPIEDQRKEGDDYGPCQEDGRRLGRCAADDQARREQAQKDVEAIVKKFALLREGHLRTVGGALGHIAMFPRRSDARKG